MIHDLTIGHLDPALIRNRVAFASEPLNASITARILVDFPGLKVDQRDGYVVVPWHGKPDAMRGEAFVARMHAETGCLIADRRNGKMIDPLTLREVEESARASAK